MPTETKVKDQATKAAPMMCPACGASLTPRRGEWRCTRCGLGLCLGCEPEACRDQEPTGE